MIYLSKKSGFTLIELVIVLAIIAMAAAVTTVSIGRTRQKALIRDESARVQGALRQARQASLMQRVPVSFVLDIEGGSYSLFKNEAPFLPMHAFPGGLSVTGSEAIVFFPKGNSTGGSLTITGPGGRSYFIEVDSVTGIAKLRRL